MQKKTKTNSTTTRKNLTIDQDMAEALELIAENTGHTQSEILNVALSQPIMRRFFAFTNPTCQNPIVTLLDHYQAYEWFMTPRTSEMILQEVKEWIEERAIVERQSILKDRVSYINSYVHGHMTDGSMKADPYFKDLYDESGKDEFITFDMETDDLKRKVITFIDKMLSNPLDKHLMGESFLYRSLLIIIDNCFEPPTKEDQKYLLKEFSNGFVLPRFLS